MDPTQAIGVAEKLAAGNDRMLLAFLCVTLVIALGWTLWRLITEIKGCSALMLDVLLKKIDSDTALAKAIEGGNQVNRAMFEAMRANKP